MSDIPTNDEGVPLHFDRGGLHYFWVHEFTNDGDPIYHGYDTSTSHGHGTGARGYGSDQEGPTGQRYAMLDNGDLVPLKDYKK